MRTAPLPHLVLALALASAAHTATAPLDFNRDVRPILAEKCFHCHGQDAAKRKAKLRLDDPQIAFRLIDGHAAIVPGNPDASELVKRITTSDLDDVMPPPDAKRTVTPEQIAILTRWIAEGAAYQRHWAFSAPIEPALPVVRDKDWTRTPIDRFIRARLDAEGLTPTAPSPPAQWLRRVSLDLTGLPATPAESDAFIADVTARGEAAYAMAADRLLASPRYGERMAQEWLDTARYADTHGFNNDTTRSMWRWRDWVIDAFNANLPYDRFITAQLAGDLLPDATLESRIATGYGRNHVINSEGGIISEEYRVEYVADRVRTLGMSWLGLTVECARCHDHKYDPVSQRDYYRLFAFFNNLDEMGEDGRIANAAPLMPAPTRVQQARLAGLEEGIAREDALISAIAARAAPISWPALREIVPTGEPAGVDQPTLLLSKRADTAEVINAVKPEAKPIAGTTPAVEADAILGLVLPITGTPGVELNNGQIDLAKEWSFATWVRWDGGEGPLFSTMNYRVSSSAANHGNGSDVRVTADGHIDVRRAEAWPHYSIQIISRESLQPGTWHHVVVTYDGGTKAAGLRTFIDGRESLGDVIHDDVNGRPGGIPRLGADNATKPNVLKGSLAGLRFYQRALAPRAVTTWSEIWLARLLVRDGDQAGAARARWAQDYFLRLSDATFVGATDRRAALHTERIALRRELPSTMVMSEMIAPRQAHVLVRGQYDAPGDAVEPGIPEALGASWPSDAPRNRLGLVRWLTQPSHPLTARVVVNRLWQQMFGTGLVKTSEDFGLQGEFPSHPELLDWLATRFVAEGWNVKALLRTMVLSATYRQDSALTPTLRERDPENRLLARSPRLRLSAEMIRDQALAVSGLLRQHLGGPSLFPYQPAELYKNVVVDAPYPGTTWTPSSGDDLYRRSLYTFWKRTVPHPVMSVLDVPDREACTARRARTNTPLQALTLMNEPAFVEAGRALGLRLLREGGDADEARLVFGFRLTTGRRPAAKELAVLRTTLERMRSDFQKDVAAGQSLLAVGSLPAAGDVPVPEQAAWAALGGVLLNLDATLTKH